VAAGVDERRRVVGLAPPISLERTRRQIVHVVAFEVRQRAERAVADGDLAPHTVVKLSLGDKTAVPLDEAAEKSILIAGGIGITPILSMVERLGAIGRDWELVYCSRKRSGTAFLERLQVKPRVRFNFDEEPGGRMLDIDFFKNCSSIICDSHISK